MKRPTPDQRKRHRRNQERELRNRARRLWTKRDRLRQKEAYKARLRKPNRIAAPAVFEIESEAGRREVVRFLADLREYVLTQGLPHVVIDFSRTKRMTAAGTILFAAELHRINALAPQRLGCNYPPNNLVAQVLQHVGIFAMLNQRKRCRITAKNVKYWKVDSGTEVVGANVGKALKALRRYQAHFTNPQKRKLYGALTEAQTNCKQHAYLEERGDGHGKVPNWWMFYQHLDHRLTVAFCDLGIGIPRCLPGKPDLWKRAKRLMFFRGWKDEDAERIRAAMAIGASRTRKGHRGKGLHEMRSALDGLKGRMQIHSNRGLYMYDARTGTENCTNFAKTESILGTIVLWTIPVPP